MRRLHHLHAALVSLTRRRLTSRLGLGHLLLARLAGRHWRHENVTGRAPAADHFPVDEQEQPTSRRAAQQSAPEDIVVYARVAWRNLLPVKRIAIAHVRPAKLVLLADSPFDARDRCLLDSRAVGACHALWVLGALGLGGLVPGALECLLVLGAFNPHHRRRSGFLLCSAERAEARLEVIARELERGLRALEGRARHIAGAGKKQASKEHQVF